MVLGVRHLPFRPYALPENPAARFVGRIPVHQFDFFRNGSQETHLDHKLNPPFKPEGSVSFSGIQVQFRRDSPLPEFSVDQR